MHGLAHGWFARQEPKNNAFKALFDMKPAFSICVYCGSKPGLNPEFSAAAAFVGTWIGTHGGQLVYGGGKGGLMGIVATAALKAGGHVVGVMPKALVEKEWANTECSELHIVDTMHDRKRLMAERADAFLALPGGIGTFEELFEVWTWRQLGYHDKPIGILNVAGYFDPLLSFLAQAVEQQFMGDWQMSLIHTEQAPKTLLERLVQGAGLTTAPRLEQI
jgi:uncharacterized protein (TIGR00730 family)